MKVYEFCTGLLSTDYKLKFYYHSPTKLCEGNVFSRVCQSVNRGGM